MAKKDKMTWSFGQSTTQSETCTNITFSVGLCADNGPADVMLVQTLFNYIGKSNPRKLGFSMSSMPAIDGRVGPVTRNAIFSFQRAHQSRLLSVDGVIHPAKYEGRVIKNMGGRMMTITLLDRFAHEEGVMTSDPDYIRGLINLAPQLAPWLV